MKNISGNLSKSKKTQAKILSAGFREYMNELFAARILKHSDFDNGSKTDNPVKFFEKEPARDFICNVSGIVYRGDRFQLEGIKRTYTIKSFTLMQAVLKGVALMEDFKKTKTAEGILFVTVPQLTFRKSWFGYRVTLSLREFSGHYVT